MSGLTRSGGRYRYYVCSGSNVYGLRCRERLHIRADRLEGTGLRCSECGTGMSGLTRSGGRYRYYVCSGSNVYGLRCRERLHIRADRLEGVVWTEMLACRSAGVLQGRGLRRPGRRSGGRHSSRRGRALTSSRMANLQVSSPRPRYGRFQTGTDSVRSASVYRRWPTNGVSTSRSHLDVWENWTRTLV